MCSLAFYRVPPASLMVGPNYTAPSCPTATVSYSTIYPNSCDLLQRAQAWPSLNSAHRLTFGQTKSYSVPPCLLLAATISPAGRSRVIFYQLRPASLMVGPYYTAPSCPTSIVSYSTIYPNSCDFGTAHASLANSAHMLTFGETKSCIVQPCLPLAATIESLFLMCPARILDGRDQLRLSNREKKKN